ncbi:hypothetical protein GLYMA_07G192400v4 [Glycine max]|nr:hypothetical protein GLYMA_07G192400v4 [Glycine max]KAH1087570.1 hypothetical protein GYH30_018915 [Glycine max]
MLVEDHTITNAWPPIGAPLDVHRDEHWTNFDSSVNAVSFGFVATAVLISMFLVMAIFERFLRPTSQPLSSPSAAARRRRSPSDVEAQIAFSGKLAHASPKCSVASYDEPVPCNNCVVCLVPFLRWNMPGPPTYPISVR